MLLKDALTLAEEEGLDLVEIAANAEPPVCKIIDFNKFRYQQVKKEKESKKAQHQVKVKEVKFKPNIDEHDFLTKEKHSKEFLEKGFKVKITCVFRGRELLHTELGEKVVQRLIEDLKDISIVETPSKLFGKSISTVLAPVSKKR
jgi:translation initiation factor IF-3